VVLEIASSLMSFVGFATALLGFIYAACIIGLSWLGNVSVPGWSSLMEVVVVLLASHECKNVFKASEVVGTGTRSPVSPPASHRQLGIRRPSLADSAEWADMLVALLQGAEVL
jgi:hypothetical protein